METLNQLKFDKIELLLKLKEFYTYCKSNQNPSKTELKMELELLKIIRKFS